MITRSIEEVKLSSAIADELLPSITGDGFRGDNSWLATMRALLPSRLPDGAKVQLRLLVKETPSKKSRAARLEYYLDGVDTESPYTITVVDVKPTTEDMAKVVDAFRHLGIANHEFAAAVYERLHSGEYPLSVLVYSDHDKANTVVFVERLNYTVWHVLQGLMRKGMFKRLFEEKPCTEQETRLLQALAGPGDGYDTYISLMEEFAAPYDFRSAAIRRAVTAMASKAREARIRKAEQTVKNATDSIEQYRREIYRLLSVRTDAQERLMGMRLSQEQDAVGKELSDFFLANRRLLMTDQDGSSLTYWVKTYLSYWDDRSAPTYLASHSSYLYSGAESAGLDHGKWERMLRDIFIDRKVRVRMCAAYRLKISDSETGIEIAQEAERPAELKDYLKNPHSMYYNCWGSHINNVTEALEQSDFVGAISATIAAASQLTLGDASAGKFSRWLAENEEKCIELPDGRCMTCREYLETM